MNCPRCKSIKNVKDGIVKGKQRHKCKDCNYRFTVEQKSTAKSEKTKKQALQLYLEGLGFRSIGRFLSVSHVSVFQWIKKYGKQVDDIRSEEKIKVVEIDEMHTYIGHKKTTIGYGYLLIGMGKDLSTAYLAIEERKRGGNYGKD